MPKVPITMPQLGESMAEATIVAIKVKPGDKVAADQEIIEVETDKAVMGVTTPCPGEIAKIDAEVKGTYAVGAVLGYVEASEADAARFQKTRAEPPQGEVAKEVPGREEEGKSSQNGSGSHFQVDENELATCAVGFAFPGRKAGVLPVPAGAKGAGYLSPRVRRGWPSCSSRRPISPALPAAATADGSRSKIWKRSSADWRTAGGKPSAIRTGVADAMRRSWTRPLATVGVSVCLDPVLQDRAKRDPKPGPALYVLRALALALAEMPAAAARLIGGRAFARTRSTSGWRWKRRKELWFR